MANNKQSTQSNKQIVSGILWIASPFIVLVGVALLQVVVRLTGDPSSGVKLVVNLISVIGGIIGAVLVIAGPVIGILKLIDRKR